ncbi:hypothetical protein WH390_02690 [Candidatus Arsenophonus nilaparvatae]|uniref:hypothetical protein n=1 Tax=Candidatus Arsenophonus nilaparvatae TaxID=1247023 RepID=UPI0038782BFE
MKPTLLSVEITDNDLKQALKQLENAAYDLTPLMRRWSETLKTATDLNFEEQGGHAGNRRSQHSPARA